MTELELAGRTWFVDGGPVRDVHVSWVAEGPVGADEARAIAFALAGALGTVLGTWLAGFIA